MWNYRVAPELKSQIASGKIDLTAIVNTHQYVIELSWAGKKRIKSRFADICWSHWDHAGGNDEIVCMLSRVTGCYLGLTFAPVETIQGPSSHWWQRLRVRHQDSRARRRIQDRRSHLSEGIAYSLSYARQRLLLYARWRPACCFHGRYSVHWRYVYHFQ